MGKVGDFYDSLCGKLIVFVFEKKYIFVLPQQICMTACLPPWNFFHIVAHFDDGDDDGDNKDFKSWLWHGQLKPSWQ